MQRCMKRSSPQASMPVSFSRPFQFKAFVQSSRFARKVLNPWWLTTSKFPKKTVVDVLAILQIDSIGGHLLGAQLRSE